MNEQRKICVYKNETTGWKCPYEALEDSKDGFCVFHERRKDKNIDQFKEGIKRILEDKGSLAFHFDGFFFPSSIDFSEFEFKKDVYFIEAEFSGKNTSFSEIEFLGYTSFERATFSGKDVRFVATEFLRGDVNFDGAEFLAEQICFDLAKFSGRITSFWGARFSGKYTSFLLAEFSGEITIFREAKFLCENTSFCDATFAGANTDFSIAQFLGGKTDFSGVSFPGRTLEFYYARFENKILFDKTYFEAKTNFTGVDLRKCAFIEVDLKNVDFSLIDWHREHKLLNETYVRWLQELKGLKKTQLYRITGEIYRELKVHFQQKRDFGMAGMFHYREKECEKKAQELPKRFVHWIFLWILKLSCGYGERLRDVVISSVVLVVLFAFGYMFLGLHNADESASLVFNYNLSFTNTAPITTILKDFWTSLVFSIKGFFPLWRFQQYKVVGDFANLVAGFEFLLGAFMVGLFVYVFRRRMDK